MTSKFEITITGYINSKNHWEVNSIDVVMGETLVEALSKLVIIVAQLEERRREVLAREIRESNDDDIPF